ncbi:uncharacterized protein RHOBADRAFT_51679 [Rhodotorula graminis WP1]|uniref:Uncharacterized protein n=1 Tax=Rhodotorula graminis (strain WP1) TaxID=578459 RepID=A0A194SBQ2_RHOGW|nr:uncharacterized protein RHOBADRAFT_51679 [Rhodotorula graminis WP1]KPV77880.1 hypothetical protein RHOBADRAFT_51679 [Rhodotorula graminis WP1]
MAAPLPPDNSPTALWPVGDDLRTSWQDLFLHTRLAALQAGLARTAYTWDDDARQLVISSVGNTSTKGKGKYKEGGDERRVDVDARDGGWPVEREGDDDMTRTWNAQRRDQSASSASSAEGADREPGDDDYLTAELIRRRDHVNHGEKLNFTDLCIARTRLRCALEPMSCSFSVVLEVQVGSTKARCVELRPEHSCEIEMPPPPAPLSAMLDYFGPTLLYGLKHKARVLDPVTGLKVNRRKLKLKQKKAAKAERAARESEAVEPEEPKPLERVTLSQSERLAVLKKAAPPPDKGEKAGTSSAKAKRKARSVAWAEKRKKKRDE